MASKGSTKLNKEMGTKRHLWPDDYIDRACAHGQQPWKTDIYRARTHHRASALSAVLPIAIVRTRI